MRLPRRLDPGDRVALTDHLDELRQRLIVCLGVLAVSFGVAYAFRKEILTWLYNPIPDNLRAQGIITISPLEPFMTSLTVSIWAAIAVAFPIILWQVWGFLAPAFEEKDQKVVSRLVMFAGVLFLSGVAFGRFVVLPAAIPFLLGYDSELYNILVRAREYLSFALVTMIGVGLVFQLPVVVLGLVRLGILSASRLRRNRRIGIVICVAVAVALPGIDPVTTLLECVPLLVLFEGSIWMAGYFEKRWLAQAAAEAAAEAEQLANTGGTSTP